MITPASHHLAHWLVKKIELMDSDTLKFTINCVTVQIAYLHRAGTRPPLVYLHGSGSTKEVYADLPLLPDFQNKSLPLLIV